ncbi:FUSC family protein, partial [Novosphingobium sp. 1949]
TIREAAAPFFPGEGALALPALVLLCLAGLAMGDLTRAGIAVGAAFSVGLGSAHTMGRWRYDSMLAALVGMMLAGFSGTLLGRELWLFVPLAALVAGLVGYMALRNMQVWWTVLQLEIGFLIAGHFAGGMQEAATRAAMILLGGGVQLALVMLLARLFPSVGEAYAAGPSAPEGDRRLVMGHVARAVICVGASLVVVDALGLSYGYWAPVTALLVLKPHLHETRTRGLQRLGGTLLGCLLATLYAIATHGAPVALIAGLALAAWCAFSAQKIHYVLLTAAITGSVVLMVSLAGTNPAANAEHRLLATLVGGMIALLVAAIVPHKLPEGPIVLMDRAARGTPPSR